MKGFLDLSTPMTLNLQKKFFMNFSQFRPATHTLSELHQNGWR